MHAPRSRRQDKDITASFNEINKELVNSKLDQRLRRFWLPSIILNFTLLLILCVKCSQLTVDSLDERVVDFVRETPLSPKCA